MVDDLIISVLKEYIMPSDYALHDWDTIIERRTQYSDDVYIYHCVYADIYITDDLEFYDAEPKQPIHMDLAYMNLSDENQLIISTLKEYVMPTDYNLHNWSEIIGRREKVMDGVYSYPCVYANIMLTDDLEFYDAEPKQPIHGYFKKISDVEELIINVLCKHIPLVYRDNVDWAVVLSRREEVKPNLYKYRVNNIDFYLDDELNPIEYGKVHIIDNNIYYDFELNSAVEYDAYVWFSELNAE